MKTPSVALKIPHLSYGERVQPSRDWYVIVLVAAVLLGFSVGWNLWLFARITGGGVLGQSAPAPAVSQTQLEAVRSLFDARAAEQQRYLHEYTFADPSSGHTSGSVTTPTATTTVATSTVATTTKAH